MLYWPFENGRDDRPGWRRRGGPRSVGFASERGGGRKHAACDLIAPRGTPILAIAPGRVLSFGHFYEGTWSLVVLHEPAELSPFLVRYGEVLAPADGGINQAESATVTAGQTIARVGQLNSGGTMLHLELYATTRWPWPSLSVARRWDRAPDTYTEEDRAAVVAQGWFWDFQRRLDMADPTDFLIALHDGATPAQPIPYGAVVAETEAEVGVVETVLGVVDPPFDRTLDEIIRSQPLSPEEERRLVIREGPISTHGRRGTTGPWGLDRGVGRRMVACEYNPPSWESRHGPD